MRDFKGMKRQRGRNRNKAGANNANNANPNRSWDSQGPENIKVRGNAQTVYERYQQLARDAASSGDRVLAENYQQHAEHYYRVLRALQPQRSFSDIAARELSNQGFDIDFEDESGAQAAAFLAAQQAAERQAQDAAERAERAEQRDRDPPRDRDQNRDPNRDREQNREGGEEREPRAEGDGGRRESRRERWERRREERNRRFETQTEGGAAEADPSETGPSAAGPSDGGSDETAAVQVPTQEAAPAATAPIEADTAILRAWREADGAEGVWGQKMSEEIPVAGWTNGAVTQYFQNGVAYWADDSAGVRYLGSGINSEWLRLGGVNGALGAPTGVETDLGGGVKVMTFDNGRIYYSPETGSRAISGGILVRFLEGGGHEVYGAPATGEYTIGAGRVAQDFAKGVITWP